MSKGPGESSLAKSLTKTSKKWLWASVMWELLSCSKAKLEFKFSFEPWPIRKSVLKFDALNYLPRNHSVYPVIDAATIWRCDCRIDRALFVWPWNENVRATQKQDTNGNRAIWLVYRTDVNAPRFWLVNRTLGWNNFMPDNFLEINRYFALTSYCNTIGQSNKAFSISGFSLAEKKEAMFWSFHPLADKTNNEHLRKPFFKVIRKSL